MRRHPVLVAIVLVMLLGSAWFFVYETAESDHYNTELSFDLVRVVAAIHNMHRLGYQLPPASGPNQDMVREWDRIRFILSRWEAEQDSARREIIKLVKRAVHRESTFDNEYMQQYSGRIVMTDVGRGEESYPLYQAARRIMKDNILGLSLSELRSIATFVDSTFSDELELVRRAHSNQLDQGASETLAAAFLLQDVAH